jgi:hypothetical protein
MEIGKMTDQPQTTAGRVIRQKTIARHDLRANRDRLYVFGDNMEGRGLGGQAAAMRGEPNAVGVPTKWRPDRSPSAYFSDADADDGDVRHAIIGAFDHMRAWLAAGKDVVIPADGLGTGLSELPARAPRIFRAIEARIASLLEAEHVQ